MDENTLASNAAGWRQSVTAGLGEGRKYQRQTLAAQRHRIAELEAEVERLRTLISKCDRCSMIEASTEKLVQTWRKNES